MGAQRRKQSGAAGIGALILAVALYVLFGPAGLEHGPSDGPPSQRVRGTAAATGSESALRSAIRDRQSEVMITLEAEVVKVLPDDNEGSRHQRLLLVLDEPVGQVDTVLIAHNIDLAERVPCAEGERVTVRGQYEWNDKGGVIHWTHHDPKGWREGGWIEHRGVRYE